MIDLLLIALLINAIFWSGWFSHVAWRWFWDGLTLPSMTMEEPDHTQPPYGKH